MEGLGFCNVENPGTSKAPSQNGSRLRKYCEMQCVRWSTLGNANVYKMRRRHTNHSLFVDFHHCSATIVSLMATSSTMTSAYRGNGLHLC
jgi:hypothetical protein